jgi:hypothetical protein
MKYFKIIGIGFILLIIAMNCKEEEAMVDILDISIQDIELNYKGVLESGNTASFNIKTTGAWQIAGKPDWINLSRMAGERGQALIHITVDEIGPSSDREGSILVESIGETRTIVVKQIKKTEELDVFPTSFEVNFRGLLSDGNQAVVYISTNSIWSIADMPGWITPSATSGKAGDALVTLVANKNTSGVERNATFTIQAGALTQEVGITQNLSYDRITNVTAIEANQHGVISSPAGGIFTVVSLESWTVSADDWIHVDPPSANAGTVTVSVTLDEITTGSTRYGTLTFTDADGLTTGIPVTQAVIYPDDGKPVNFVYFEDDMSWCEQFGGIDEIENQATGSTIPITDDAPKAEFTARGYEDINPGGSCFYLGKHYFKMGKTNYQTGIRRSIPNIDNDKATNIRLTFSATPVRTGGGNFDKVFVWIVIEGPGSVGVDDGATKESGDINIQIPDKGQWYWVENNVVLYGVTADTRVTMKTNKTGTESGTFRWCLNSIKFEKHSLIP